MPLSPGSPLGGYEIISLLGAGGMGEVYRARDPRLEREVAIKVLTSAAAGDPELLRRLKQEAKTVAALNHPNLLSVYDLGATPSGAPFLVMELLQGETLRARLGHGPLGLKRALAFGRQIADGLAAAHDSGIVHRDLKPENIFVLADGRIKILDFGLAKAVRADAAIMADGDAPTLVGTAMMDAATLPGVVLGTIGYMAPEQVRGEPATARSDIFAFGAIFYEMLSGKRAFSAASGMEAMSAILRDDPPDITVSGAALPLGVERLLRRCLEKDPRQRFQTAADLSYALATLEEAQTTRSTAALAAARTPRGHRPAWRTTALVAVVAVLITLLFSLGRGAPDITHIQYSLFAAGNVTSRGHWSPDGTAVAYAAAPAPGDASQVFLRYLSSASASQLTHAADFSKLLGWTADGHSVLFVTTNNDIDSVAIVGGAPQKVGAFPPTNNSSAFAVSARAWAVFEIGANGRTGVWISSPPGSAWKPYEPAPFSASQLINEPELHFSPDGTKLLLFVNAARGRQESWILPFPADSSHPPFKILANAPGYAFTPQFAWMPDGRHILTVTAPNSLATPQLALVDTASGRRQTLTAFLNPGTGPTVSPDGTQALFVRTTGSYSIVSARLSDGMIEPVIDDAANNTMPDWALHAPVMVYITARDAKQQLWLHSVTSTGESQDRPLADLSALTNGLVLGPTLSPNADRLLYASFDLSGPIPLMIASTAGGKPVPFLAHGSQIEVSPTWSPDGSQAAFTVIHGQTADLMAAPTTGLATARLVHANLDSMIPVWSPDGRWIAYQAGADDSIHLVSPDGKSDRNLGKLKTGAVAFSADSKLLYGIDSEPHHNYLFSVDIASGAQHRIADLGEDFTPQTQSQPSLRFTLTPDGKALTFNTARQVASLIRMRNFVPQPGFAARLRAWLHLP